MKILRISLAIVLFVLAGRAFNAGAQTVTILHSFAGVPNEGVGPRGELAQGSDGSFYGTTTGGGTNGDGTVFRISPSGSYTDLHFFDGSPNDGAGPYAGLVQGSDGNFYGTTRYGGMGTNCNGGCGTVFRISPSGSYTNLHSFAGFPDDGGNPYAGLVQGSDGNFYGTTYDGGSGTSCNNGCGTVFRISPSGSYTNLYSFTGSPGDGDGPVAGLVQGGDGNFYGTTTGSAGTRFPFGTVFRISPGGSYMNLYFFGGFSNTGPSNDGIFPYDGLVQGSDGNFYGTTAFGGTGTNCVGGGCGTVFRISPSGSYTNLYSFAGPPNDGGTPGARLVQGSDGNFYGTTAFGGPNSFGALFRISPSGSYTNLHFFAGFPPSDGGTPNAGLVQGSDGNFYGTATSGGIATNCDFGCGTVFKLTLPASGAGLVTFSFTNVLEKCKFKPASTNCAVSGTLVIQSHSTNTVPAMTILLFGSSDSTFNALSDESEGHLVTKAIKPEKTGTPAKPLRLKLKIASDHSDSGDFIFATDANSNLLTSTQIP